MKTQFLRKASRDELIPQTEFTIEKTIELIKSEFTKFINRPLADHPFIEDNIDLMYIDDKKVWHCILVTSKDLDYGILVQSEGYGYARYSAYIKKSELVVNKNEN